MLARITFCGILFLCFSCESSPTAYSLSGTSWMTDEAINTDEPAAEGFYTALVFSSEVEMEIYTYHNEQFSLLDRATYRIEGEQLIVRYHSSLKTDTTLISQRGKQLELLNPENKQGKRYRKMDQPIRLQ